MTNMTPVGGSSGESDEREQESAYIGAKPGAGVNPCLVRFENSFPRRGNPFQDLTP